jgi:hypothetical protein
VASLLRSIAADVLTLVDAGVPYSIDPVTTERRYMPYFVRRDLGNTTHIVVVGNSSTQARDSRSEFEHVITVDVFIQSATDWNDLEAVDCLTDLSEEVFEAVVGRAVEVDGIAFIQSATTFEPQIVGEHLIEERIFTSRITTTWSAIK